MMNNLVLRTCLRILLGQKFSLSILQRPFTCMLFALLFGAAVPAFAGYDLHITRKSFWAEETGPRIGLSEWERYVRSDKEIKRDVNNAKTDFLVVLPNGTFPLWYSHLRGEIYTKNPTKDAI